MTKIEANPEAQPKTLKEVCGGDDKWALKHLPEEACARYTNEVVPLVRKKAGSLNPWETFTVEHVQSVINEVFGKGVYKVKSDGVWYGLVSTVHRNYDMVVLTNQIRDHVSLTKLAQWVCTMRIRHHRRIHRRIQERLEQSRSNHRTDRNFIREDEDKYNRQ